MLEAIQTYFNWGAHPGSMLESLIKGDIDKALKKSHPHVKQWYDERDVTDEFHRSYRKWHYLVEVVDLLPPDAKGDNFDNWVEKHGLAGCTEEDKVMMKLRYTNKQINLLTGGSLKDV